MKFNMVTAIFCFLSLNVMAQASEADIKTQVLMEPLTVIEALDVSRYMGTWYELAKFPNRFQKKCISNTKAEYSLKKDRSVQVINRCKLENGEMDEAVGVARQVGDATSPIFEVRFAPAWLSFIPAVWGDYWIIDLDKDYQLVAISEPTRKYLWVLSRKSKVDQETYQRLLVRLANKGFDVSKLDITIQEN